MATISLSSWCRSAIAAALVTQPQIADARWRAPLPRVAIETSMGRIEIVVETEKAPITAGNFLRYVDGGHYDKGSIYRVARPDNDRNPVSIHIVQGGRGPTRGPSVFPPIAHEPTSRTGLRHVRGTISMGRFAPGTAASEYFIVMRDAPELDEGGKRNPDRQGFAAFGRVTKGMKILAEISRRKTSGEFGAMTGQILENPLRVIRVRRIRR